jgi:hypothetical protein
MKKLGDTTTTTVSPQTRSAVVQLVTDVESSLRSNTTFTNMGNSAGRTEYGATVDIGNFVKQVVPIIQHDAQAIPALGAQVGNKVGSAQSSIPAGETVTANVFVQNNKMNELDVDLAQFSKTNKPPFPVPLKVLFSQPSAIAAPAGATQLDLSKLPSLLGGLTSGLGASSSN